MRLLLSTFLVALFLSIPTFAQTREQLYQELEKVRKESSNEQELARIENLLTLPDKEDIEKANKENLNVARLLSPEYIKKNLGFYLSSLRNSGASYSFYFRSQDYGYYSNIIFHKQMVSAEFVGENYGFVKDLGKVSIKNISSNQDNFLLNYVPPTNEPDVRKEQTKIRYYEINGQVYNKYEVNGQIYKDGLSAIVGHTYLLRSINFDESDILVAFTISRQDSDGSLIILWKLLEQFDTPKIITGSKTDEELLQRLKQQFNREQYKDIQFEVNNMVVTFRGTTTKKDLPNVIYWANQFGAKKVINLLEYK